MILTAGMIFLGNSQANNATSAVRVITSTPESSSNQTISVEQPANVSSYYQVDLFSKSAGTVKIIEKALGDKINAGETLIQLDTGDPASPSATITAPFDGVVSSRAADPGLFVPSAAVVPGVNALMTVDRTDIVTISMAVPEAYVSLVSKDAQAEVTIDALPGRTFRSRLNRIAPTMNSGDRTLQVEIDFFNGTADEFAKFQALADSNGRADLKGRVMPFFPDGLAAGQSAGLLPGMYGKMKLTMRQPQAGLLIPSGAIVRDGGMPYLFQNENSVARRKPIMILSDNGEMAAVAWSSNGTAQELSPNDEIIISNQGELQDGTLIQPTRSNPAK